MKRRAFVVGGAASIFAIATTACAASSATAASASRRFHLYDQLNFKSMPVESRRKLAQLAVVYADQLWPDGTLRESLDMKHIAERFGKGKLNNSAGMICLDVEHWPYRRESEDRINRTVRNYLALIAVFRDMYPDYKIGLFEFFPTSLYPLYDQLGQGRPDPQLLAFWQREQEKLAAIAEQVDVFFPQLYSRWPGQIDIWERCSRYVLDRARLMAGQKPVIPFLWPQYWFAGNEVVLAEDWSRMLNVVHERADSAVLWSIYTDAPRWSQSFGWWRETELFLQRTGHPS